MNNTDNIENKARRRKNGNRDEAGRRRRNANGNGTLIQKKSGLFMAKWVVGKEQIGEETITTADGRIEVKPKFKYVYHTESTHSYDIDNARAFLNRRTAELCLDKEEQVIDKLLEKKDSIAFRRMKMEEREKEEADKREREAPAMTLLEAFKYYRDSARRPDSGKRTLDGYEGQYGVFVDWMKETYPTVKEIRQVTMEHAEKFSAYLKANKANNTHNKYMTFLRRMWAILQWVPYAKIPKNDSPWDGIRNLRLDDQQGREAFSIEQLEKLIPVLPADLKVLCAIGLYTGLRLEDCCTISWDEIHLKENFIYSKPRKTKSYNRIIYIPLNPVLKEVLEKIPEEERVGYILPQIAEAYLKEPSLVTNRFQDSLKSVGISTIYERTDGKRNRTKFGFHSLRHSAASFMINNGAKFAFVEKLLGHSSESMTWHYYHENIIPLRSAVSKIPVINAFETSYSRRNSLDNSEIIDITPIDPLEKFVELAKQMSESQIRIAQSILSGEHPAIETRLITHKSA